jgi:hypothetical protein
MDKMLNILLWVMGSIFLFSFSCAEHQPSNVIVAENIQSKEVRSHKALEENKGKSALVFGTIIREEFTNKAGKSTGNFETLIKLEDGETVHLRNKGENKYNYEDLANKKVKIEAIIFYGNIDSDNPEHQSRVGYRIDYTVISIID